MNFVWNCVKVDKEESTQHFRFFWPLPEIQNIERGKILDIIKSSDTVYNGEWTPGQQKQFFLTY